MLQSVPRLYTGNGQVKTLSLSLSSEKVTLFSISASLYLAWQFFLHCGFFWTKTGRSAHSGVFTQTQTLKVISILDVWWMSHFLNPVFHLYFPPLLQKLSSSFWLNLLTCLMETSWWIFHWLHHKMLKLLCVFFVYKKSNFVFLSLPSSQKKLPLTSLSQAMVEGGNQLGEDSLIGWVWLMDTPDIQSHHPDNCCYTEQEPPLRVEIGGRTFRTKRLLSFFIFPVRDS